MLMLYKKIYLLYLRFVDHLGVKHAQLQMSKPLNANKQFCNRPSVIKNQVWDKLSIGAAYLRTKI